MFTHAVVRTPSPNISQGITSSNLGKPDYAGALRQHAAYVAALEACGLAVQVLEADRAFPDACFVEDTAVVTERLAVITHLGALPRQGEEQKVADALRRYYPDEQIETITPPGTLEGGDVLRVNDHFYTGLSARTNEEGAHQFTSFLEKHGYTGSTVKLSEMLHLKSGVAYLENNLLAATGEFLNHPAFAGFNIIHIDEADAYSANCLYLNGAVLVPAGYPATREKIQAAGLPVLELEVSEFRKLDGGLSCLSLRF